jgi:predicted acyl esterase
MFAWPGPVEGKKPPMNLHYEIASHPFDGPFYWERSAWTKLEQIRTPVMSIVPQGGAMHMRGQLAGWTEIQAPKKLLVVPPTGFWSHMRYLTDRNLNRQMLRWFDYWLKGVDNGIMAEPPVAIFDSGTRRWRYEAEYPLARTEWTKLYLNGEALQRGAPIGEAAARRYRMPDSYAQLSAGKPALAYTTAPAEKPLVLWGPASVTFYAASSQIDTAFFVKLAEVPPEGAPRNLSRGILKASFREVDATRSQPGRPFHPFLRPELLEPGRIYEYQVELRPLFHTIRAGHRLQLQISSEDIHYTNPLRQIDVLLLPWPVENAIYADAGRPSHLLLPVIPDAPEIAPVKSPVSDIDWPLTPGSWSPNTDGWPLTGE